MKWPKPRMPIIDPIEHFRMVGLLTAIVQKNGGSMTVSAEELLAATEGGVGYHGVPRAGGKLVDYVLRTSQMDPAGEMEKQP